MALTSILHREAACSTGSYVSGQLLDWCDSRGLLHASGADRAASTLHGWARWSRYTSIVLLTQQVAQALNGGLVTSETVLEVAKAYDSV